MERKTPLYDIHTELGGKIVPFGGYLLPIQYTGIIEEHMAVREKAGIFDVSHMGEVQLSGPDALRCVNHLCSNDFTNLAVGRARYTTMLNNDGGVIDDFLVYCLDKERYWLVVNASNRAKDVEWITRNIVGDIVAEDVSDSIGQVALQGPRSREIIAKLTPEADIPQKYFAFTEKASIGGLQCLLSRTGYTGSFGYEIYCKAADTPALWRKLLEAGAEYGLVPCALGARDTLRLEASMPLYGHEIDEHISPPEAGLEFAVKMSKPDFIGKAALTAKGEPSLARVGLRITGRGIARDGNEVYAGERRIGAVTSGTHLPYMKGAYAMAIVEKGFSAAGTALTVDIRGRRVEAEVVPMPFYSSPM